MIENSIASVAGRHWDVIVVGAGTVGLFIAFALAERDMNVLCLESGGFSFDTQAQALNDAIISGVPHVGVSDARARVIGGTSTMWGGQLARFTRADIESGSSMGRPDWPITYDELEPWYHETAKLLDMSGYDLDHEVTLRRIFGNQLPITDAIEFYATYWLKTPNFSKFYNQKIKKNKNVVVVPFAQVVALNTTSNVGKVESVTIVDRELSKYKITGKNVILSNGTLEISRLLLASSCKENRPAWSTNSFIGVYFQDHLDVECGELTINNYKRFSHFFENAVVNGTKVQPKLRLTQQEMLGKQILNVGGSIRFQSSLTEDINYLKTMVKSFAQPALGISGLSNLPKHITGLLKIWGPLAWHYIKNRRIMAFMDGGVYLRAHMEQRPLFESRISLDHSQADYFGMPKLNLAWQVDWETQMRSLQAFCHAVDDFMQKHDFGRLAVFKEIVEGDLQYLQTHYRDSFHQCGGAIMSSSANSGVVDKNCKVHETENLFIAGSAVFPSSSYANPTFTALALANRLANHIAV